jgi:hypothetical protein
MEVEMKIRGLMMDPVTNMPIVILKDVNGATVLPIWVGMPEANAWWTVFRQAMTADAEKSVGLYFGTTQGSVWASRDEGESWRSVADGLPRMQSVEVAYL